MPLPPPPSPSWQRLSRPLPLRTGSVSHLAESLRIHLTTDGRVEIEHRVQHHGASEPARRLDLQQRVQEVLDEHLHTRVAHLAPTLAERRGKVNCYVIVFSYCGLYEGHCGLYYCLVDCV